MLKAYLLVIIAEF